MTSDTDSEIKFDPKTGLPKLPSGRAWAVETLRWDDYQWLPWFPHGKVKVGIVRRYEHNWFGPDKLDFNSPQAHAFKTEASIRRAAIRVIKKERRIDAEFTAMAKPKSDRRQARIDASRERERERAERRLARKTARDARLLKRDAAWVGQYPPRKLGDD